MSNVGFTARAHAQTYQIDCAILLCLSGGWPASVPCARARAEFIRRITPWPIEPPLQIWRCPMGVSYLADQPENDFSQIYDVLADEREDRPLQSEPAMAGRIAPVPANAILRRTLFSGAMPQGDLALRLIQDRADIDISGPEFNFVRSIRVFDVLINDDRESDGMGGSDCNRSARIRLGSYGPQGEFSWAGIRSRANVPTAFGPTSRGCSLKVRAVFVDWRDFEGNYGFERVDY
ncbi:hypothetical protein D1822_18960 (plasmid) [Phaeobacter inhibens]|nr:hypothetical protein D1822_18960 [Phaeobacter inhibens]